MEYGYLSVTAMAGELLGKNSPHVLYAPPYGAAFGIADKL